MEKRGEKLFLVGEIFHKRINPSFDPDANKSECGRAVKEQIQLLFSEPCALNLVKIGFFFMTPQRERALKC